MQLTNCIWEIENIGLKTLEIDFGLTDVFEDCYNSNDLDGYEYVVAKLPSSNVSCLLGLQEQNFSYIETQITFSKKFKNFPFDNKLISLLSKDFCSEPITTHQQLDMILAKMTPRMFSTDRIYLDPELGPDQSLKRYRTWISSEFDKGTLIYEFGLNHQMLGFNMVRVKDRVAQGMLGGIYEEYQTSGYGLLTPASVFLCQKDMGILFDKMKGTVSSNNLPVVQMYNYLDFKIDSMVNVLIKHQK